MLGVTRETGPVQFIPLGEGPLPVLHQEGPLPAGLVLEAEGGEGIPHLPVEDDLGRRPLDVLQGGVPVLQDSLHVLVGIQLPLRAQIVPEDPLGRLHSQLSSAIGVRVVGAANLVVYTPGFQKVSNRRRNEETKKEERKKKKKVGYKTQSYSATSTQPICVACDTQTPHLSKKKRQPTKSLVACPVFRGLPTNKARRAIITEHKFCQKCLSPTCPLPGCYKDTCKNGCSDSHHYMICSKKDYVQPSAVSVE